MIDLADGRRLGKVMDLEFNIQDSRITALVVPSDTSLLQSLRGEKCGLVIPWEDVYRIGDDVVLVSIHQPEQSACHWPG
ncbi:MAG: YlmC/YmxH family sporulation protein [Clostridia bacterium]|nr:YlmC/YmxH family sporulation protein [Clostridia bacterium]